MTAGRIAGTILLQPKVDENDQKVKAAAYVWSKHSVPAARVHPATHKESNDSRPPTRPRAKAARL
jgi:hypothetical protein